MADDDSSLRVARRLEHEALDRLAAGRGTDDLTLALDQLQADRTNGERLEPAIEDLRRALARAAAGERGSER